MKKLIFSTILVAAAALAFALVMLPARQAQAACGTILSGSYASTATPQTSPTFSVLAGDVVTAISTDSAGTATSMDAAISINGVTDPATSGQNRTGSVTSTTTASANGTGSVFFSNLNGSGGTISWTITTSGPNCSTNSPLAFTDGRVNPQAWATAILYCHSGSLDVYDVNNDSQGSLLFTVTPEEIAEVGVPTSNTLIDSGTGVRGFVGVYRLVGGDFLLVAPDTQPDKTYTFSFAGC